MIENVMKIYFLVAHSEGKFPDLKIWYTQVSSPTEANRITRGAIDNKIYELIRTLEDNKDFVGDVVSIRNRFDIPSDGYSLKEWDEARKVKKEDKSYSKWKLELEKSCRELGKQYNVTGTPTFIADNGDRLVGFQTKDQLKAFLDQHK